VLQQLDPALVTLAQEGSKVYRDRFDLLYRHEASRPNEIWQADHTPLDMPGLEKRLARYAQLYSRVGFVHQFRTLSSEEMLFILEHHWQRLGLTLTPDDFTDAEAIAAVIQITSGNFRLVQRLFSQIERVLQINELRTITKEVVEAARENLVIGPL
jgi:DNA transposition AAA+ family ATPase